MDGQTQLLNRPSAVVSCVQGSQRLLAIRQVVDARYLAELNTIEWLARAWHPDDHYYENSTFRRRVLLDQCSLIQAIDTAIFQLIPNINRLCGTSYRTAGSTWHICESGWVCPMHTDGRKPNVMIMYWQTPGPAFGTTFYNSSDPADIHHEFTGLPNTGFFANYEPDVGEPWPEMWHASLAQVPVGQYRLMTQYEFYK
jgi:hypothetical protein